MPYVFSCKCDSRITLVVFLSETNYQMSLISWSLQFLDLSNLMISIISWYIWSYGLSNLWSLHFLILWSMIYLYQYGLYESCECFISSIPRNEFCRILWYTKNYYLQFSSQKNNVNFVCSNIICKTLDKSIRYLFASFCNSIIRCHDLRTCTLQLICNKTSDNRDTISG